MAIFTPSNPHLIMLVIAVRSFGIIGGGAVLFGASAIVGQAILPAIGEVQQFILVFWDDCDTF